MLEKDKNSVFKLTEYSAQQEAILLKLESEFPKVRWLQFLTPLHCFLLYEYVYFNMHDAAITDTVNNALTMYGRVTSKLDYAYNVWNRAHPSVSLDTVLKDLSKFNNDGDKLADKLMRDLNSAYPLSVLVRNRAEIDSEGFIAREAIPEEGAEWVLDYIGARIEFINIVNVWNTYKKLYYKSLNMVE